jgi:hypothetical protein
MHAGDLTDKQLEELLARIAPMSHYLGSLQERMDKVGFSPADRLYWEVVSSRHAVMLLADHLHKLRCGPSYPGGES